MSFLYKVGSKVYPKLKEVDDVLGGKSAWENVDSTQGIRVINGEILPHFKHLY